MSYDQRRIYLLTVALIELAVVVWSQLDGITTLGAFGIVAGLFMAGCAITGRGLRQRADDSTDPRNR